MAETKQPNGIVELVQGCTDRARLSLAEIGLKGKSWKRPFLARDAMRLADAIEAQAKADLELVLDTRAKNQAVLIDRRDKDAYKIARLEEHVRAHKEIDTANAKEIERLRKDVLHLGQRLKDGKEEIARLKAEIAEDVATCIEVERLRKEVLRQDAEFGQRWKDAQMELVRVGALAREREVELIALREELRTAKIDAAGWRLRDGMHINHIEQLESEIRRMRAGDVVDVGLCGYEIEGEACHPPTLTTCARPSPRGPNYRPPRARRAKAGAKKKAMAKTKKRPKKAKPKKVAREKS